VTQWVQAASVLCDNAGGNCVDEKDNKKHETHRHSFSLQWCLKEDFIVSSGYRYSRSVCLSVPEDNL
jgi:hypothetical protein